MISEHLEFGISIQIMHHLYSRFSISFVFHRYLLGFCIFILYILLEERVLEMIVAQIIFRYRILIRDRKYNYMIFAYFILSFFFYILQT